jgi:hypothetical protein
MNQPGVSRALRAAVAEHFQHRCCYCMISERVAGADLTIDHIGPQALVGISYENTWRGANDELAQ